jgi:nucleotide-binding universal stress UspA family protein
MRIFPTTILLATDGSEEAKLATQAATELSRETGSEVHVVYVLPTPAQLIGHHLYSDEIRESLIGGPRGTPRRSSKSRPRSSPPTAGRWRRRT